MTSHSPEEEKIKREKQHLEWGREGALGETLKMSQKERNSTHKLKKKLSGWILNSPAAHRYSRDGKGARRYHRCWSSVAGFNGKKEAAKAPGGQEAQVPFLQHRSPGEAGPGKRPPSCCTPSSLTFPRSLSSLSLLTFPCVCLSLQRPNLSNPVALSASNYHQPEKFKKPQTDKYTP